MPTSERTEELPTVAPEVADRVARHSWNGYLTLDNIGAVADRIDRTLVGKRYAFAIQHEHDHGAYRPELRTGLLADGPARRRVIVMDDGTRMGRASWADGYVWAIDTTTATQQEANEAIRRYRAAPQDRNEASAYRLLTYVAFDGDKITVKQFNGQGELLTWTVEIEDHTDYETWIEETDEPVTGVVPTSLDVRVGPLESPRHEGQHGVQVRALLGKSTTLAALADPDLIEAYARQLLVAAGQVRRANERATRRTL